MFYEFPGVQAMGNSRLVKDLDCFWASVQSLERKISYMFSLVMTCVKKCTLRLNVSPIQQFFLWCFYVKYENRGMLTVAKLPNVMFAHFTCWASMALHSSDLTVLPSWELVSIVSSKWAANLMAIHRWRQWTGGDMIDRQTQEKEGQIKPGKEVRGWSLKERASSL